MSTFGEAQSVTISASGTTSTAADLKMNADLLCVELPSSWTASTLRVQVSRDNSTFFNLGGTGNTSSSTAASDAHVFKIYGWQYVKLVCGTAQAAERTVSVRGVID